MLKIAFASEEPENDISAFSGVTYSMARAIRSASDSFSYIQVPRHDWPFYRRNNSNWHRKLEEIGQFLSKRLREVDADVLICSGSVMIPFLQTEKPISIWVDSTWYSCSRMSFEEFKALYPYLYECDYQVLEKCRLVVFAADWVREQTLAHYDVSPQKIEMIPWGANIEPPAIEYLTQFIDQRKSLPCNLAFLGKDWVVKGLPLAFDVMAELNLKGIPAILSVIGCNVPAISPIRYVKQRVGLRPFNDLEIFQKRFHKNNNAKKLGFLDKRDSSQHNLLCQTLIKTHFLLHPAIFEPFGIVLPEANAFGVPVITSNNHGPRTSIRNGINGYLFSYSDYVKHATNIIENIMGDFEAYRSLALNSYNEYQNRLNWNVGVKRLLELIVNLS